MVASGLSNSNAVLRLICRRLYGRRADGEELVRSAGPPGTCADRIAGLRALQFDFDRVGRTDELDSAGEFVSRKRAFYC